MNLIKSLAMAKAITGITNKRISGELNTSQQQVANWCRTGAIKQSNIVAMAKVFDMKVSEFIALGES